MIEPAGWDTPDPFAVEIAVEAEHIDRLGHVNNAVYLRFLERAGWAHTQALGLCWADYRRLDAACVVHRHEIDYLRPALAQDRLSVATWITANDARLTLWRAFQIRRHSDGRSVLRAATRYVCVCLSSGRPTRMPAAFVDAYRVTPTS